LAAGWEGLYGDMFDRPLTLYMHSVPTNQFDLYLNFIYFTTITKQVITADT